MTDAVFSLLLFALFVAGAYGVGGLVTGRLRPWHGGAERALFATALGMGVLAYLVFLLGLLRSFHAAAFALLLAGAAASGVLQRLRTARGRAAEETHEVPQRRRGRRTSLEAACGIVLAGLGLFTLIGALAPPGGNEWDALAYQLAVPKIYLREGRIFYVPWVSHSNFPFTLQMLYTLMLGLGSIGAAKLCHWLCGALLVLSVYTFAARHIAPRGNTVGLVAALIVATTPIVLWEASVAYVDLATALFTWLSLYALFNAGYPGAKRHSDAAAPPGEAVRPPEPADAPAAAIAAAGRKKGRRKSPPPAPNQPPVGRVPGGARGASASPLPAPPFTHPPGGYPGAGGASPGSVPWLVTSAALMGLALGTKYTVLGFWGMLLSGILVWRLGATGRWAKETLPHAALWGGISLLVAAPWYVKSWLYTGNPVYPFYFSLFGGRYWNEANAAAYAADQARFGVGKGAVDLLLAPWQMTMPLTASRFTEYPFGLSPVYLALLLAAPLFIRRLSRTSALLSLFGLGVYVFWFFLMQQTRYSLPALPALAVVSAEVLVAAWQELPLARWFGAALVAASAAWALYRSAAFIAAPALPVVTGQITTREHLARSMPGVAGAVAYINRETPRDAKVALFDEVWGFYLDRPYLWATPNHSTLLPWESYKENGVDAWLADFKRRGYTTLLVNTANSPAEGDGQAWRRLLRDAITQGKVTLAFAERGVEVYRIP